MCFLQSWQKSSVTTCMRGKDGANQCKFLFCQVLPGSPSLLCTVRYLNLFPSLVLCDASSVLSGGGLFLRPPRQTLPRPPAARPPGSLLGMADKLSRLAKLSGLSSSDPPETDVDDAMARRPTLLFR